ncbi:sugar ABC transporter ATP-binding protein [Schaalia sp. ZJ1691]|uniref:sugar ABC transporter ATP-binding protein n=1 Tax=Schaalia sp. ZJ1691 TaxID=2709404 RepID=UPI00198202C7|nr:sugar ABC transporter ATP-binding protein [Schaalia sp. ZJ1691]
MMTTVQPLLEVSHVTKRFSGTTALNDVNFTVFPGTIVCLAGENGCGKSTLVKVISGVHAPDSGSVAIGGRDLQLGHPQASIDAGIQVIFQDLALFDHLTIAENIAFLRTRQQRSSLINRKKIVSIAREQLTRIGVDLDPSALVSSLSVANKQIVAICRALSMNARVLFMDEPTTALTSTEVDRLLSIVLDLKRQGLSVVFISHKLDEVFKIADSMTILRDGVTVGNFAAADLDEKKLAYYMTGRDVEYTRYQRTRQDDNSLLETRGLTRTGHYADVNVQVKPGDILGITGLLGSGRTEFALSLFGLNAPTSGSILVEGTEVSINSPSDALAHGIALLPEDRKKQALFLRQSVERNITSSALSRVTNRVGSIASEKEKHLATQMVEQLRVNNRDITIRSGALSGGNQQKVVIGKWMAAQPTVLILDSPTVGIDIGSKDEIYEAIQHLASEGMGLIVISDEAEEIATICNKVLVMHAGRVVETFRDYEMAAADFKKRLARIIANPPSTDAALDLSQVGE